MGGGGWGGEGERKESLKPSLSGLGRKRESMIREECAEPADLVRRSQGLICHLYRSQLYELLSREAWPAGHIPAAGAFESENRFLSSFTPFPEVGVP